MLEALSDALAYGGTSASSPDRAAAPWGKSCDATTPRPDGVTAALTPALRSANATARVCHCCCQGCCRSSESLVAVRGAAASWCAAATKHTPRLIPNPLPEQAARIVAATANMTLNCLGQRRTDRPVLKPRRAAPARRRAKASLQVHSERRHLITERHRPAGFENKKTLLVS